MLVILGIILILCSLAYAFSVSPILLMAAAMAAGNPTITTLEMIGVYTVIFVGVIALPLIGFASGVYFIIVG